MIPTKPLSCSKSEHHHFYHHSQHTEAKTSQTHCGHGSSSCSRRILNSSSSNNECGTRCKFYTGYESHLHYVNDGNVLVGENSCTDTGTQSGCYSPHPNQMLIQHHGKLSIQSMAGIDESTNCYLPPPSPAPNSDRFIMGVMPSQNAQICGVISNVHCLDMYASYYDGGGTGHGPNRQVNAYQHSQHQQQQQQHHQHQQQQQLAQNAAQSHTSSISPDIENTSAVSNLTQNYISNSIQKCSITPNTRFRLSDRFREVPTPKSLVLNTPPEVISSQNVYATTIGAPAVYQSTTVRNTPSNNFLAQSTPLVTSDTYTYLTSAVHTPVKRYVPTPPPLREPYTDTPMQPPKSTPQTINKCENGVITNIIQTDASTSDALQATTQHVNTLPYRFRMKCCSNGSTNTTLMIQAAKTNTSHMMHSVEQRSLTGNDQYDILPRMCSTFGNSSNHNYYNNVNCNNNSSVNSKCTAETGNDSSIIIVRDQHMQSVGNLTTTKMHSNAACLSVTSPVTGCSTTGCSQQTSESSVITVTNNNVGNMHIKNGTRLNTMTTSVIHANNSNNMRNDFVKRTSSCEYINTTVVNVTTGGRNCTTPVIQMEKTNADISNNGSNNSNVNSSNSGAATTCLHCNTVRRTTGVHQTTQTTGPISPTPLQQMMDGIESGQINMGNYNNGYIQTALDQASYTLTPSTSESHISPLSPTNESVPGGTNYTRIIYPSKISNDSSNSIVVDQMQSQKHSQEQMYVTPLKSQQQKQKQQQQKHVITQSTIAEQIEVVANNLCSQSMSSECQLLQASPIQSSQQQQQQHSQRFPTQKLHMQQHMQQQQQQQTQHHHIQQQQLQHCSHKKRLTHYIFKEIACFFGVDVTTEAEQVAIWEGRQRRLALRRFGALKNEVELSSEMINNKNHRDQNNRVHCCGANTTNNQHYQCHQDHHHHHHHHPSERPDILPAHDGEGDDLVNVEYSSNRNNYLFADFQLGGHVERKASVATMIMSSITFIVNTLNKREHPRNEMQQSRNFAPNNINNGKFIEDIATLQENEVYLDSNATDPATSSDSSNIRNNNNTTNAIGNNLPQSLPTETNMNPVIGGSTIVGNNGVKILEHHRQMYMEERFHGWQASAVMGSNIHTTTAIKELENDSAQLHSNLSSSSIGVQQSQNNNITGTHADHNSTPSSLPNAKFASGTTGNRLSAELMDDVLENSRHQIHRKVRLYSVNDLDDRDDHRPFFTYWINTVQILVLLLSVICYGIGPIGIGIEQKTGQVLVTSLSLQTVQHTEQRNIWIGPRNNDLVHLGAKFATCMRNDYRVIDVLLKTRRQERETACCIRNDDSGCVQSSQADCSVRGLFPTKSISTWKKWSAGESGPGGRISGSVCGLDPKYCDAPASVAPYEWPDDITKWPICRKTNSFSQRFRYKDHTAEHMVCEVIGHPCCTGVYGECRITTREYCDFVNGYFHEEASLCSQISCLNNVCGMLPFISVEVPDQFYRLFTSLCLHAGFLHLAITIAFQHIFLSDLERLIGPIRTAIVYIGSGLAGNLTSAVLVPYKPEVGPLASLSGVVASLAVLLVLIHWKQLCKPHIALFKLLCMVALLFAIGTLPWQLNFAGLLAGTFCGIFLTVALVPFVSITEYGRKAKIKLIWSCVIFHLSIYTILLVTFYVIPTNLTALNNGEMLNTNFNPDYGNNHNGPESVSGAIEGGGFGLNLGDGPSISHSNIPARSFTNDKRNKYNDKSYQYQSMQPQQQYYYHHRSSDIITGRAVCINNTLDKYNTLKCKEPKL